MSLLASVAKLAFNLQKGQVETIGRAYSRNSNHLFAQDREIWALKGFARCFGVVCFGIDVEIVCWH